jgi:hypothetical protein
MMAIVSYSYKIHLLRSSLPSNCPTNPLPLPTNPPLAIFPKMPSSAKFSDIPSTCRRNHCPSCPKPCTARSCNAALSARLARRDLTITTKTNVLNPILDNIEFIKKDIRHKCDRSAWKGREITRAHERFAAAMGSGVSVQRGECRCKVCAIERRDAKIARLVMQYVEAKRWLDVLKKFRWRWDLDASSVAAGVGR